MKKLALVAGGLAALLALGAVGVRVYMVWDRSREVLPLFTEPGAGPRAPRTSFLGLDVGKSTLEDAELAAKSSGVVCENSSMRALMQANRERIQKEMADARARGEDPDGVTGASLANYVSRKEQNPQVRLACKDVPSSTFADRERTPGSGYWLIIHDSAKHPLRHTSYQRMLADSAIAAAEWRSAVDTFTKTFGAVTTMKDPPLDQADPVPPGSKYEAKWTFADLEATVSLFRIGGRIQLMERVEVPWPVRADAPQLK